MKVIFGDFLIYRGFVQTYLSFINKIIYKGIVVVAALAALALSSHVNNLQHEKL